MDIITVVSKKIQRGSDQMMMMMLISKAAKIENLNNVHSTRLEWIA
ncbi:hypothetical protein [Neobacillus niacini]|nr:hypothetical protein [Neobacillus niacini]